MLTGQQAFGGAIKNLKHAYVRTLNNGNICGTNRFEGSTVLTIKKNMWYTLNSGNGNF